MKENRPPLRRKGTKIKKQIVIAGMLLLIVGIPVALYSTTEDITEENIREIWDIWPSTLTPPPNPQNRTFWGRLMRADWWFELNISSSHPIRVMVSVLHGGETRYMVPIFNEVGSSFTQEVQTDTLGTYQVDILNEGTIAVDISGNVTAKGPEITKSQTEYPYAIQGALIALAGMITLLYGTLKKPKLSKSRKATK